MKGRVLILDNSFRLLIVLIMILQIASAPYSPARAELVIRYVNLFASGDNDGTTWTHAYNHLQDALDEANAASSGAFQIWVANGIYYPDLGSGHTNNSTSETFTISHNNIQLYGGFDGGESSLDQRDWMTNITILSGDIDGNDTNTDGNYIAEDWNDIVGNNALHVLFVDGALYEDITANVKIDGFVITAGDAIQGGSSGAGIFCNAGGSGAVCSPTLRNLLIIGNQANAGGGVQLQVSFDGSNSSPTLTNVSFMGNKADVGGGLSIWVYDTSALANPLLINCSFIDNYADVFGGGLLVATDYGGESNVFINNVEFIGNEAEENGGGISSHASSGSGGSIYFEIRSSSFYGNQGANGGGIYSHKNPDGFSDMVLQNTILWGNSASVEGDQIYNSGLTTLPYIEYSDIQGSGGSGPGWFSTIAVDGGNNIDEDPDFKNPTGDDLSLLSSSPAINAGNLASLFPDLTDMDEDGDTTEPAPYDRAGGPRVVNSQLDMGAFEYGTDTIGMHRRGQKTWYLKDANTDGWADVSTFRFGSTLSSWLPVEGDWNGDGIDTIGMYSRTQKTWYLKDANTDGWANVSTVRFGSVDTSWIPVVGDWDGDGTDTIGMYSRTQKTWYLKDANDDGWANVSTVRFGSVDSSWIPVVGDWNDCGPDKIGMYSRTQKTWYLKGANDDGWANVTTVRFGSTLTSWIPVMGDWDGNGADTIGMYSRTQKTWYLKGGNTDGWGDVTTVRFGSTSTSWIPVTGKW